MLLVGIGVLGVLLDWVVVEVVDYEYCLVGFGYGEFEC